MDSAVTTTSSTAVIPESTPSVSTPLAPTSSELLERLNVPATSEESVESGNSPNLDSSHQSYQLKIKAEGEGPTKRDPLKRGFENEHWPFTGASAEKPFR